MKEATVLKHLKDATYEQAEEQPDGVSRWAVTFGDAAGNTTLQVVAENEKEARENADEAYRNYLKVTGKLG